MKNATREHDLQVMNSTENGTLYSVQNVGRCWIPDGYTLEVRHEDERVVVRHFTETIAIVKGISAAKTKVTQHVPRQFRTRVESTWLRYYPQYWADGRWHNLTNARGEKVWFERPGEAKIELLIFLARQQRPSFRAVA
jgi:hypothetical protein